MATFTQVNDTQVSFLYTSFVSIHKFRFCSVLAYALIQNQLGQRFLFFTKLVLLLFSPTSQVSNTTDNRSTNHQHFSTECPSPTWSSKTSQASFIPDQECCSSGFLRCFRDPIRVPRMSENYHRGPRIREIRSLQVHTGYLTFSLKKTAVYKPWISVSNVMDKFKFRQRNESLLVTIIVQQRLEFPGQSIK